MAGIESTAKMRSVVSTMISASASGVSIQMPGRARVTAASSRTAAPGVSASRDALEPARTKKCSPWKRSLTGKKRRVSRTTQVELGSVVSRISSILTAVAIRKTPNSIRIQENSAIRRAPIAIIAPRITSAPRMPQNSTRCW